MKSIFKISAAVLLVLISLLGTSTITPALAAAPKGEIIYAVTSLGSEDFSLAQQFGVSLPAQVQENIIRTNHIGDPSESVGYYPHLAERWEVSPDSMTYDFFIRKGVQFHDGWGELTADDLVYTFDLIADPDNKSAGNFWFAPPDKGGIIESYEAVGKYQFRVKLSKIHLFFLDKLTTGYPVIFCKKYMEKVGKEGAFKHPIGTGPWKHVETVPGDHMKFEAVENHWNKTPAFKYLTYKLVPDPSTQIFMLQSGQVNMATIAPEKIPEIKAAGLKIVEIPERYPAEVFFGGQLLHDHEKFDPTVPWASHTNEPDDSEWNQRALKVRKALSLAINHQAMIDKVMRGYALPGSMHDITISHPWHKPEWTPIPYDLKKAKALLAEAGYANGFEKTVQVLIPPTSITTVNTRAIAELVASNLEALGIKIERRVMEQSQINTEWMFGYDSAWKIRLGRSWVAINPGSGWAWSRASSSPLDEVMKHPKWDELVKRLDKAITVDEQKRITQEAYDWAHGIYECRGLFVAPYLVAVGPVIKGYSKNPLYYESQVYYRYSFEFLERAAD